MPLLATYCPNYSSGAARINVVEHAKLGNTKLPFGQLVRTQSLSVSRFHFRLMRKLIANLGKNPPEVVYAERL
jgi:hypothetical protein